MSELSPAPSSSRKKRIIGIVVVLLLVALAAWLIWRPAAEDTQRGRRGAMSGGPAGMMNMAVPVKVSAARSQDFDIVLRALGTVTAYNTVTVRSRVEGELVDVNFQEGQFVQAGDVLAQVDPRPYEVALAQAQGTQMQNRAQLENARRDLGRYQTLFKQDSIARQQLDTQAALVRQYEGTVKSDQAAVDNAKLQLAYSRITAPISGRLGLRQVDQGNLISSGDTNGLVVITQTDPIAVIFTLPETQLPDVLAQLRDGRKLQAQAYDRADTRLIATGELETVDNQIDVTTGTVKLKARFANADQILFPNQFVNIRLLVERRANVTAIPTVAVQQGSVGSFVFLVQPDKTVAVRPVKLGTIDQGWVAVNEGLAPGDQVVVEGTDRLRTGSKVDVVAGAETDIPALPGASLGAGAPAGTNPSTIKRPAGSGR